MSTVVSSVKKAVPAGLKKRIKESLRPKKNEHAPHPSDTNVLQFIKKNGVKLWRWLKNENWKWVLATLIVSGIIHILAVLNLPSLAPKSAWFRLQDQIPVNEMKLLERMDIKPAILPMMAPDVRYAICRYDLSKGPVTIRSKIPNELFSVAAYNQLGQNYYIITGQALQRDELYLVITQNKNTAEEEVSASEKSDDVVVINSKSTKGVILLRSPVPGAAYENQVEEQLKTASCSPGS